MKKIKIISLLVFLCNIALAQDLLNLPLQDYYTFNSQFSSSSIDNGLYPLRNEQVGGKEKFFEENNRFRTYESWLGRKLFDEHFLSFKNNDFYITLDPLLNLSGGRATELSAGGLDQITTVIQNTRGLQIQGEIANKVAFYTSFHENQAVFASYLSELYDARGEQYLLNSNYVTQNATIPRGARTKPFNTNGYDYAFSTSYISIQPTDYLNIQFGNAPEFIGYGKRSMLLSDYAGNRTTLKFNLKFTDNIKYSFSNGQLLNLLRRPFHTTVEAPYEKKGISTHYFSYRTLNEKLSLNFFESSIWFKEDSVRSQNFGIGYYNPLPILNTAIAGFENNEVKNLIGLNIGFKPWKNHLFYTQFVLDDFKNAGYGYQVGYKTKSPFNIKNLTAQIELNVASRNLYAANNRRLSYSHNNYPLAYALGNSTKEIFTHLGYQFKSFYFSADASLYQNYGLVQSHERVFQQKTDYDNTLLLSVAPFKTLMVRTEIGYRFNINYNLSVFGAVSYRKQGFGNREMQLLEFGIKTDIINTNHVY